MKNNYNILEKIFHKLILKNNSIQEMLFDTEQRFYVKEKNLFFDNNFFISGLARSGTTLILECFYKQEIFASLTYNDMPLICAPNLWHKISKNHKRKQKSSSRMHNDGIIFNLELAFIKYFQICHTNLIYSHIILLKIYKKVVY